MQVILAQVACDLPTQDGCSWHRVSSALYNGLLGQRASYAAVCGDGEEVGGPNNATSPAQVHSCKAFWRRCGTGAFLPAAGEIPSLMTELRQVECVRGILMTHNFDPAVLIFLTKGKICNFKIDPC